MESLSALDAWIWAVLQPASDCHPDPVTLLLSYTVRELSLGQEEEYGKADVMQHSHRVGIMLTYRDTQNTLQCSAVCGIYSRLSLVHIASELFPWRLMPNDVAETLLPPFDFWPDLSEQQSPNGSTKHPPWTTQMTVSG